MANYYRNHLIIRGEREQLRRFHDDALPRDGEQVDDSWGGHGDGPLSFFSLLPPPKELQCDAACKQGTIHKWRKKNWGCYFPQECDCSMTDELLQYYFVTENFCAHNFIANVSNLYPALAFRLVWRDVYSGDYGTPVQYALLAVQAGRISCDYVEMSGNLLTKMLKDMDKGLDSTTFFDFWISSNESTPDPSIPPHSPDEHSDATFTERIIPGPTTDEMQVARQTWPSVPESQTVGEFLASRENHATLAMEDGAETFVLYRWDWPPHVAFLSCTKWQHHLPLNVCALVLPWLASLQRIANEPSGTANYVPDLPTPPEPSTQEGQEKGDKLACLF